ncbi:putative quinol monooxygenase [Pseudomonas entomophila]|uniref:putative quinol monooxygenase n=1 Tax=Pseudomonas entomophila TaxID=312306 RepID=UPI003EC10C87
MNEHTSPIVLLATLTAKAGQADALKAALLALVEPTRAEPGNLDYMLFERRDEPGRFCMREAFAHQAAFDAHVASEHFQRFLAGSDALLAEPPQLTFLDPVSSPVTARP